MKSIIYTVIFKILDVLLVIVGSTIIHSGITQLVNIPKGYSPSAIAGTIVGNSFCIILGIWFIVSAFKKKNKRNLTPK